MRSAQLGDELDKKGCEQRATVLIDSCPLNANFDQEAWVMRLINWEELGPDSPHAFVQLADSAIEVINLLKQEDIRSAQAAQLQHHQRRQR